MAISVPWTEAVALCRKRGKAWVMATVIFKTGSVPRDNGTKMLITDEDTYDTIGGGRLEFRVIQRARELLLQNSDEQVLENFHLAAKAQQCCGGSVSILFECFKGQAMHLHVFGAGHVAKALMKIAGELDARVDWVDNRAEQFPEQLPSNVQTHMRENPVDHVTTMSPGAFALVVTHDHGLDYDLLEALMKRKDCGYIGLIGSQTKAKRFKKRLQSAGFSSEEIDQVYTPVGLATVPGKRPMEVAVSIAGQLIQISHSLGTSQHSTSAKGVSWQSMKDILHDDDEQEENSALHGEHS